jgi:molybdenum cofactor sulfurtransferase
MQRETAVQLGSRYQRFLDVHPDYAATSHLDRLRAAEFGRLDALRHVYLDYTGSGLYAESQVAHHAALLQTEVFGNPHSANPTSSHSTRLVEATRAHVLNYFNAGGDYTAVFTQNASGALKLVGESYPFEPGGALLLTSDNHNSVNGIREYAHARRAEVEYAPLGMPELRVDSDRLRDLLARPHAGKPRLFAFPAQSNFSGVKHPLELIGEARDAGWHVLLDAAAFVPTNRLDLQKYQPEFVALSFYKMFGYPTGVGCLLIRNDAVKLLRRPWFAGGTVNFASVRGKLHVLSAGEAGFEDGTLNYLAIPAVSNGLRLLETVGIDTVQARVQCLTAWLLTELLALKHSNGRPMVRLYGPATTSHRGGVVTLNIYDPAGCLVDYRRVEELAGEQGISLRTGCFCNPGAGETAERLSEEEMTAAMALGQDISLARFFESIKNGSGKSAGAVRLSLGIVSNFADVEHFLHFVEQFRDETSLSIGEVSFDIQGCRVVRDSE